MKAGHITPGCQSKAKCFNSGARYHVTICENPKKPVQPRSSKAELASPSELPRRDPEMLEHQQCMLAAIITLYCCRQPKPLFLDQIIRKLECNTQVIFDSCSPRSYITSKTCEQLNLPTIAKETLLIKTFGDSSAPERNVTLCNCASGPGCSKLG